MERPKYEVLRRPDGMPDYQASAMKYYADTLLYLDEKYSACGGETPGTRQLADKVSRNYDAKHDVLYVGISDRRNSYGDEVCNDVILLRDADTNAVTGLTIFDFQKRQPGGATE